MPLGFAVSSLYPVLPRLPLARLQVRSELRALGPQDFEKMNAVRRRARRPELPPAEHLLGMLGLGWKAGELDFATLAEHEDERVAWALLELCAEWEEQNQYRTAQTVTGVIVRDALLEATRAGVAWSPLFTMLEEHVHRCEPGLQNALHVHAKNLSRYIQHHDSRSLVRGLLPFASGTVVLAIACGSAHTPAALFRRLLASLKATVSNCPLAEAEHYITRVSSIVANDRLPTHHGVLLLRQVMRFAMRRREDARSSWQEVAPLMVTLLRRGVRVQARDAESFANGYLARARSVLRGEELRAACQLAGELLIRAEPSAAVSLSRQEFLLILHHAPGPAAGVAHMVRD